MPVPARALACHFLTGTQPVLCGVEGRWTSITNPLDGPYVPVACADLVYVLYIHASPLAVVRLWFPVHRFPW